MEIIYKLFRFGHNRVRSSGLEKYEACPPRSRRLSRKPEAHEGPNLKHHVFDKGYTLASPELSLSQGEWTCGQEHYKYPINQSSKDPWEKCNDVVNDSDEKLCKGLSDEISYLLVVASLFLAIVTAFTIESLKWIQVDQGEATVARLDEVIRLHSDPSTQAAAQPRQGFEPKERFIVVNQLWFLSMTLSMSAVVVGTLCLQWLSAFQRTDVKHKPHDDAIALRQLRYEGLMAWGVPRVPAILLLTVQGALVLFATGLLYLLWSVNKRVALPVAIVSGVTIALLALTTLMPLVQSLMGWIAPRTLAITQCPYKAPISWVVHRFAVLLAIICSLPLCWLPCVKEKMSEWREQQLKLLTDYLWQEYDELWRRQRERWGPQKGSQGYSYYLVRGLAFAMERLVFQPEDVHIIHACLQDFHGTRADVETFEKLFSKDFAPAEEELLQAGFSSALASGETGENPVPSTHTYLDNLRRDFLNAHALQHFVAHNQKLHRTLLPHRVELYIRIKNSSRVLKGENQNIGTSIECPVRTQRDAQGLPQELRIQFLKCADALINTEHFRKEDTEGTRYIAEASEDLKCEPGLADADSGFPADDKLERAVTVLLRRLSTLDQSGSKPEAAVLTEEPTCIPSTDQSTRACSPEIQDDQRSTSSTLGPEGSPITPKELYQSVREKLRPHVTVEVLSGQNDE